MVDPNRQPEDRSAPAVSKASAPDPSAQLPISLRSKLRTRSSGLRRSLRNIADELTLRRVLPVTAMLFALFSAGLLLRAFDLRGDSYFLEQRGEELEDLREEYFALVLMEELDREDRERAEEIFTRDYEHWCMVCREHFPSWETPPEGMDLALAAHMTTLRNSLRDERDVCGANLSSSWWGLYFVVVIGLGLALTALIFVARDAESNERIADLYRRATRDPMTGGLNRAAILDEGLRSLARCQREGRPFSVMIVDLDHFKGVNDGYGHAAGDRIIEISAHRIRENLRDYDSVGRYGGDEFLVVLPDTNLVEIRGIAERLSRALAEPIGQPGLPARISASIGAAVATGAGSDLDAVIECADRALYQRKARGRCGWVAEEIRPFKSEPASGAGDREVATLKIGH